MAKIEHYTCDFCGVKVEQLTELIPLELSMDAAAIHQSHTYHICPWCATVFKKATTKDLCLKYIQGKFDKTEN